MLGENCWLGCGSLAGTCDDWCGNGRACCKLDEDSSPFVCAAGALGCAGFHCCVEAQSLLVDAGENNWPVEWFGNFSVLPVHSVVPAPWYADDGGSRIGYDFSLPRFTRPSSRSLLTLRRSFLQLPNPPTLQLPQLGFKANAVFDMWVTWRNLEPTAGAYQLDALDANYRAATATGRWKFALRLLTSRVAEAPEYLAGRGIRTIDNGLNYDPLDPIFHARYLALLDALRDGLGLCQRDGLAMLYAGYASTSWGDEYIGPHSTSSSSSSSSSNYDPAVDYLAVRERLDRWARVCENATGKVMMGGESAYGRGLGFGTRNGFVEHYWYQVPDPLYGQYHSYGEELDQYLRVNSSAALLSGDLMLCLTQPHGSNPWTGRMPRARMLNMRMLPALLPTCAAAGML